MAKSARNANYILEEILDTLGGGPGPAVQNVAVGWPAGTVTKEWTVAAANGAQTDLLLIGVDDGFRLHVLKAEAYLNGNGTDVVNVRCGLALIGGVTLPPAALAGAEGVFLTHPGLVPGGGVVRGDGSSVLAKGASGQDARLTCSVPTGGSLRVLLTYFVKQEA